MSQNHKSSLKIAKESPNRKSKPNQIILNKLFIKKFGSSESGKLSDRNNEYDLGPREAKPGDSDLFQKLPAIAELINLRARHLDPEIHAIIVDMIKYIQNLEHIIRSKEKEIQRLEYINKYLTQSQQNKEYLLTETLEENRRLRGFSSSSVEKKQSKQTPPKITIQEPNFRFTPNNSKKTWQRSNNSNQIVAIDNSFKILRPQTSEPKLISPLLNRSKHSPSHHSRDEKMHQSLMIEKKETPRNEDFVSLDKLLQNPETFIQELSTFERPQFIKAYELIKTLKEDHSNTMNILSKLQRIIKATNTITTSFILDEAIERIVEETCECLDCDRASIFIYDNRRDELWSKGAKGSEEILRVPVNKGIVGHVFTRGESLNTNNPYLDERFHKEIDTRAGYKIMTLLAVPIKDESDKPIGVLQALNKKGTNVSFTKDDEALSSILSDLTEIVLRNSMIYNEQLYFHNALKSVLNIGIDLNSLHSLNEVLKYSKEKISSLIGTEKALVVLKDPDSNELFSILEDGTYHRYPLDCGIIGKVIRTGRYENVPNGYGHPLFNGLIDIETSLPLLCVPIHHPHENKVIGAIEIVNLKRSQGIAVLQMPNNEKNERELLNIFCKVFAQSILDCYKWKKI